MADWFNHTNPEIRKQILEQTGFIRSEPEPVYETAAENRGADTISQTVYMRPFGKARPRVTDNGTYMPASYTRKKKQLRGAFDDVPDGLVHLSVTAVRKMPKSWGTKKREKMRGTYAKPIPDVDNIAGAVMDALFGDDSGVVSVFCEKIWGDEFRMDIEISKQESVKC